MNALKEHLEFSTREDAGKVLLRGERLSKIYCDDLITASHYAARDMLFGHRRSLNGVRLRPHEFYAVRNVSLEVKRGEVVGILGASQSGKSALTSLLGGLLVPDEGKLVTYGRVLLVNSITSSFKPMLTLRENVLFRMILLGASSTGLSDRSQRVLEFAGLVGKESIKLHNFPPDEIKRVGLSILLHAECELLVFDELPSAQGDDAFHQRVVTMMHEFLATRGVVIATRKYKVLNSIADRVLVLDAGEVIFEGPPKEASVEFSRRMGIEKRRSFSLFLPRVGGENASTADDESNQDLVLGQDSIDEFDELNSEEFGGQYKLDTEDLRESEPALKHHEVVRKRKARGIITNVCIDGKPIANVDLLSFPDNTVSRVFEITYTVLSSFQCDWARVTLHQPRSVEPMTYFTLWDINAGNERINFSVGETYVFRFRLTLDEVVDGIYGLALTMDHGDHASSAKPDLCKIAQVRKGMSVLTTNSAKIHVWDLSITTVTSPELDNTLPSSSQSRVSLSRD